MKAATRLQVITDDWDSRDKDLDEALTYNRKLWTILVSLGHPPREPAAEADQAERRQSGPVHLQPHPERHGDAGPGAPRHPREHQPRARRRPARHGLRSERCVTPIRRWRFGGAPVQGWLLHRPEHRVSDVAGRSMAHFRRASGRVIASILARVCPRSRDPHEEPAGLTRGLLDERSALPLKSVILGRAKATPRIGCRISAGTKDRIEIRAPFAARDPRVGLRAQG